jgi:hypothetical protein
MPTFWCCCGCPVHFLVKKCFGVPAVGAVVTIYTGYVIVGTCTTNSFGRCDIDLPSAGSYTVQVDFTGDPGYEIYSQTISLVCNQMVTVNLVPDSSHWCATDCCGGGIAQKDAYWTDALGTVTFNRSADPNFAFAVSVLRTYYQCSFFFVPFNSCGPGTGGYGALVPVSGLVQFQYFFDCVLKIMHITWVMCYGPGDCTPTRIPHSTGTVVAGGISTGSFTPPGNICGFNPVNSAAGVVGVDVNLTGTCSDGQINLSGTMPTTISGSPTWTIDNPLGTSGVFTS